MNVFKCIVVVLGIILSEGIKGTASDTHCGIIVVLYTKIKRNFKQLISGFASLCNHTI